MFVSLSWSDFSVYELPQLLLNQFFIVNIETFESTGIQNGTVLFFFLTILFYNVFYYQDIPERF